MFICLLLLYTANNTEQVILWPWPCLYTWQSWIEIPFEHITEFDALTSAKVGEVISRDQLKVSQETTSRWDFVDAHMRFAACMSSALNGSSALQCGNAVEICKWNKVQFLPRTVTYNECWSSWQLVCQEKYLSAMDKYGNTHLPALCAGKHLMRNYKSMNWSLIMHLWTPRWLVSCTYRFPSPRPSRSTVH